MSMTETARRCACISAALMCVPAWAQNDLGYDPVADPFAVLNEARAAAVEHDKLVLVIAGGEWCIWCHYLNAFLEDNPDIEQAFKEVFVTVKVYFGDEADNSAFFAMLPEAVGYPHFWVIGADGEVLVSQNTLPLEDGAKSYDRDRFMAFVEQWRNHGA